MASRAARQWPHQGAPNSSTAMPSSASTSSRVGASSWYSGLKPSASAFMSRHLAGSAHAAAGFRRFRLLAFRRILEALVDYVLAGNDQAKADKGTGRQHGKQEAAIIPDQCQLPVSGHRPEQQ